MSCFIQIREILKISESRYCTSRGKHSLGEDLKPCRARPWDRAYWIIERICEHADSLRNFASALDPDDLDFLAIDAVRRVMLGF